MDIRALAVAAALLGPASAFSGTALSTLHPEQAIPDNLPPMASPGPYGDFIKQVQQKLHEQGFDAGPVNGDFGTKTQAALAQFQLSQTMPASGMLDGDTLRNLGVARPQEASAASGSTIAK